MIYIAWGPPAPGCEQRTLELLDEAIGLYGRMQQEGLIDSFDVGLMKPNGETDGFVVLRGTEEQLGLVGADERFRRSVVAAKAAVQGLRVYPGYANTGVAEQLARYRESVAGEVQPA
jgi:ribosomal protein S18 acetylase RimI-like enzyme